MSFNTYNFMEQSLSLWVVIVLWLLAMTFTRDVWISVDDINLGGVRELDWVAIRAERDRIKGLSLWKRVCYKLFV